MLHLGLERRLILVMSALLAASAILAIALTPALSDQVRPMLQSLGIISCTSSGPCQEGKNASTGPGLEGVSAKGSGVIGQTTSSGSHAGVLGQDKSTSASEAGVKGTSANGAGLVGQSTNGPGMMSSSTTFDGLESRTFHNSTTTFSGASGVFGGDGSSDGGHLNAGVTGSSFNGMGVEGVSDNWVGVNAVGGFQDSGGDTFPALSIVGNTSGDFLDVCSPGTANPCDFRHNVFSIYGNGSMVSQGGGDFVGDLTIHGPADLLDGLEVGGNVNITGQYQKNFQCVAGCSAASATSSGRAVASYATTATVPAIEDFGEAQLTNGYGYVQLGRDFANVIDGRTNYFVFITPEGDNRGLYVTQKSARGFAVRESQRGRSSLAFSYRIVAKPFGSHEARLPMVELPRLHQRRANQARQLRSKLTHF